MRLYNSCSKENTLLLLLSTQQRPCASSTAPHTLQLALPTRRTPLLTGRHNPSCLAFFWLLGVLRPSGHPALPWLLHALLAPRASSWFPVPSWTPASPGHLLSSSQDHLFSNLPSARCLPSHSAPFLTRSILRAAHPTPCWPLGVLLVSLRFLGCLAPS